MDRRHLVAIAAIVSAVAGCEGDDPDEALPPVADTGTEAVADVGRDTEVETNGDANDADATPPPCGKTEALDGKLDGVTCKAAVDDYFPGKKTDPWPACISDDGKYHPFNPSIGSVARAGAFETIATLLGFGTDKAPSAKDFLDAREAYLIAEGIESRVTRREDEHYPPASKACRDMTPTELAANPDRCVGPAKMQPILNAAFADGATGKDPQKNAARIEATLLWFFYLSVHKEAITCTSTPADCDSSWAYYTGGEDRPSSKGLSRYVRARSLQAHDRIWDGSLAVRCWRDLDNPTGAATNLVMRDRAVKQLDTALLRGIALIVRTRLERRSCGATWELLKILGPVLDREARVRDSAKADVLAAQWAKATPEAVDEKATLDALDALFPCP